MNSTGQTKLMGQAMRMTEYLTAAQRACASCSGISGETTDGTFARRKPKKPKKPKPVDPESTPCDCAAATAAAYASCNGRLLWSYCDPVTCEFGYECGDAPGRE